ncbi:MAG: ATPase [Oscillatoria sp. SIO1A7]|nr:ATPase [Oscillatoria sp. SIO1A7]
MSRPYSLELFSRRSLSDLYFFIKQEILVMDRDTPIFTGVQRSLERSPELLYEPIVVVLAPGVHQLLDVHQLLVAQMRIHEITTEALHRSEAKSRQQTKELSKTLQELQRTQSQLVHTEKMSSLGQLVAGIAHEINNPISFISGNIYYASEYSKQFLELLDLYEKHYPEAAEEIQEKIEEIDDIDFIKSDLARILESMGNGADRIKKIVESLRNFSRLDESDRKKVDIREGIENTVLLLQNRLNGDQDKPAIEVIEDFEELPLVECYPGELNQVFMNIFTNAIDAVESLPPGQERRIIISTSLARKHSPANPAIPASGDRQHETEILKEFIDSPDNGSVAVPGDRQHETSVGTKHSAEELSVPASGDRQNGSPLQESVIIRIADSGLGMSEEVSSRLFDPFFTTKPVGKGTGLGLSVSYQIIVEKHKGNLSCRSLPGRGTEFAIEIPIRGA